MAEQIVQITSAGVLPERFLIVPVSPVAAGNLTGTREDSRILPGVKHYYSAGYLLSQLNPGLIGIIRRSGNASLPTTTKVSIRWGNIENQYLFISEEITKKELTVMADAFNILMVIALGSMAGIGLGLVLGSIAGKQKGKDSETIRKEKIFNSVMVNACTFLCIVTLAYYSLFYFG
jgi:hypothetical protein